MRSKKQTGNTKDLVKRKRFATAKKALQIFIIASFVFTTFLPPLDYANAVWPVEITNPTVPVTDTGTEQAVYHEGEGEAGRDAAEELRQKTKDFLKNTVWVALKTSLHNFLNTIAYDLATWLASGGEGQQPMFITEGWGEYLKNVADSAGGVFIEELGGSFENNFNLCNPSSLQIKIGITAGLQNVRRPRQPNCTVTQLVDNWSSFTEDRNFLDIFSTSFGQGKNDISIAINILDQYYETTLSETAAAAQQREEDEGLWPKLSKVTEKILTPSILLRKAVEQIVELSPEGEKESIKFGDIIFDPLATFVDTLTAKLIQRLLNEGLLSGESSDNDERNFPDLSGLFGRDDRNSDLYTGETGVQAFGGTAAAKLRFIDFLSAGFRDKQPYDILSKFSFCPTPENPGTENCVIKPEFRTAIERQLTLREAIEQGFINGDAPFGFMDYDSSAIYRGMPYRSIVILRSHRVVPVGWEIAAEIIDRVLTDSDKKTYSLYELIAEFENEDSPFYGLIDDNWVLKVPDLYCKAEGYGASLIYDQKTAGIDSNGDGDYSDENERDPQRIIGRAEYCADYQSCIEKNPDGSCKYFGYCTEERRTWNLGGTQCPAVFNTCQTFQDPIGQTVSYLKNTLDFNGCNADNAGCQWYCREYSTADESWTCVAEGEKVLRPCGVEGGCSVATACNVPIGEQSCTNIDQDISLTISEACNENSQWYDSVSGDCAVTANCTIAQGAVACQTDACSNTAINENSSFEVGPGDSTEPGYHFIARNWKTNQAEAGYFELVDGSSFPVHSGRQSIRFFTPSAGGFASLIARSNIVLEPGIYTYSGWIYNRLNRGVVALVVYGNDVQDLNNPSSDRVGIVSDEFHGWKKFSVDFRVTNSTTGVRMRAYIADNFDMANVQPIDVSGENLSGAVYFDDLTISQSCVSQTTLTLTGEADKNESKIFLDRDAQVCDSNDAGCSEFIRLKENAGANIIPNSGFEFSADEISGWSGGAGTEVQPGDAASGNNSLKIVNSAETDALVGMLPNTKYFLSFWAKGVDPAEDNSLNVLLRWTYNRSGSEISANVPFTINNSVDIDGDWRQFILSTTTSATGRDFKLNLVNSGDGDVLLDSVQLTPVGRQSSLSGYSEYGQNGLVYLKQAPDYLGCNSTEGELPPECYNYALYCEASEVGCQAYQPVNGGLPVPGKVSAQDYCPAECVGYDAYLQTETAFESRQFLEMDYFIPATGEQCQAQDVGCTEFTNLDEVAQGGEGREYYTYLRRCVLPDSIEGESCSNYYTWQGSDEAGYQLSVYSLLEGAIGPELSLPESSWPEVWGTCNGPEDLETNPYCRQMYDSNGDDYYVILDNTVSCSNECHPFRKTETGDSNAQANCTATNGDWNTETQSCIYYAIPSQGLSCSPQAAGCREYKGNTSANAYIAFSDNFEDGNYDNWGVGDINSTASNNIAGKSLVSQLSAGLHHVRTSFNTLGQVCGDALPACSDEDDVNCFDRDLIMCRAQAGNQTLCLVEPGSQSCGLINDIMQDGKTYVLNFWAKNGSSLAQNIEVDLTHSLGGSYNELGTVTINDNWQRYTIGAFTPSINETSALRFMAQTASQNFYIDNVEIREVSQYAYVIKNSWNTPLSCDTNPFVSPPTASPQFMLGCKQYTDLNSAVHNLKSFTQLCRDDAVGCEALIDTHNSSSPFEESFNAGLADSDITVPADSIAYLTNRNEFRCNGNAKGCEAVGVPNINNEDEVVGYQTGFVLNNPDIYSQSLCSSEELWCQEYLGSDGAYYFKDPKSKVCEYRRIPDNNQFGWFKIGSASLTPDCPLIQAPIGEPHPTAGFAGLCAPEHSSCTQYIDPASYPAKNLVNNGTFSIGEDGSDNWLSPTTNVYEQTVELDDNTVYTYGVLTEDGKDLNDLSGIEFEVGGANCLIDDSFDHSVLQITGTSDWRLVVPNSNRYDQHSGRFRVGNTRSCTVRVKGSLSAIQANLQEVFLKKTETYYNLSDSVDKYSCNGVVDHENGCVLFNDRGAVNYSVGERDTTYLIYDSDIAGADVDGGIPPTECVGDCDSNAVMKVRPDRVCGTWLSCTSQAVISSEDGSLRNYCLNLGLCNSLDDSGQCNNYLTANVGDERQDHYPDVNAIQNLSGYSNPGVTIGSGGGFLKGYFPYHEMEQFGSSSEVSNGNFERGFEGTAEPIGWRDNTYADGTEGWTDYKFQLVRDSAEAPEGSAYLKLNSFYQVNSEEIDIEPGRDYILSGWVNTLRLRNSFDARPSAQICVNLADGPDSIGCVIELSAGLGWQYVSHRISADDVASINKLTITLRNYYFDSGGSYTANCADKNQATECPLGGYSLFDDIGLHPVLTVANGPITNGEQQFDYVSRSCRLYPSSSAFSCQIYQGNTILFGQYGYCLTVDPSNPSQCVQWYPVDQLQGEVINENTEYADRAPLYYCTRKETTTIQILERDTIVTAGGELPEEFDFIEDESGTLIFVPFQIPPEFRTVMRFPYIQKFSFRAFAAGIGTDSAFYVMIPVLFQMYHDGYTFQYELEAIPIIGPLIGAVRNWLGLGEDDDDPGSGTIFDTIWNIVRGVFPGLPSSSELHSSRPGGVLPYNPELDAWGGFGAFPIALGGGALNIVFALPTSWSIIRAVGDFVSSAAGLALEHSDFNALTVFTNAFANTFGAKVITDQDNEFASYFDDPTPDLTGDILGFVWFFNQAGTYATFIQGKMESELEVQYCSQLYQVVTSSGQNKAWSNRVKPGSGWVQQETVRDFNLFTQAFDNNVDVEYYYEDPFLYDEFIAEYEAGSRYFSSDYRPFGSIVTPKNAQTPGQWDSKQNVAYNQPLLYEPARVSFNPPYQARMGEVHNRSDLQQLFLKSYGYWEWKTDNYPEPTVKSDDRYVAMDGEPWDLLEEWENISSKGYCNGGLGDNRNALDICRVRPRVENILINDRNSVTMNKTGSVKLSFTVNVNAEQVPLRSYVIDWGDGETLTVTGASLLERSNPANPFVLYHSYDYWKMKRNDSNASITELNCFEGGGQIPNCTTAIKIKVKDNWNAESCRTGQTGACNAAAANAYSEQKFIISTPDSIRVEFR